MLISKHGIESIYFCIFTILCNDALSISFFFVRSEAFFERALEKDMPHEIAEERFKHDRKMKECNKFLCVLILLYW